MFIAETPHLSCRIFIPYPGAGALRWLAQRQDGGHEFWIEVPLALYSAPILTIGTEFAMNSPG
jgi:hypothetical protein